MTFFNYLKSMHKLNIPSFFFIKSTSAPQGDTLGHMYPFLNNSSSCICNSFNLGVLILYGSLEIGVAIGTKSIEKSIYFHGGYLVFFSNTCGYSYSTRKYYSFGPLFFSGSSTWTTYNWYSIIKNRTIKLPYRYRVWNVFQYTLLFFFIKERKSCCGKLKWHGVHPSSPF